MRAPFVPEMWHSQLQSWVPSVCILHDSELETLQCTPLPDSSQVIFESLLWLSVCFMHFVSSLECVIIFTMSHVVCEHSSAIAAASVRARRVNFILTTGE